MRRYWFDALLAVAVVVGVVEVVLTQDVKDGPLGPLWFDILAVLGMTLPLFARRRFPFGAPVASGVVFAGSSFVDGRLTPHGVIPFLTALAVFVLFGLIRDQTQAITGLAFGIGVTAIIFHNDPEGSGAGGFVFTSVVFTVAWAIAFGLSRKFHEAEEAKQRLAWSATTVALDRHLRVRLRSTGCWSPRSPRRTSVPVPAALLPGGSRSSISPRLVHSRCCCGTWPTASSCRRSTAVLTVIVAAYTGYSFAKFRYRGRRSLMYLVLASQMFPQALLLITLYLVFSQVGLINSYLALILSFTTFTLPLCVWMLKGFFDTIPDELIEAAKMDGAGQGAIIHRILLPVSAARPRRHRPFAFIRGWNDFIFALTLAGPDNRPCRPAWSTPTSASSKPPGPT